MVTLSGSSNQRGFLALRRPNHSIGGQEVSDRSEILDCQPDDILWQQSKRILQSVRWASSNPVHIRVSQTTLISPCLCQRSDPIAYSGTSKLSKNLDSQPHDTLWQHTKRILESVQWVLRNLVHIRVSPQWQFWRIWAGLWTLTKLDFGERATA